MWYIYNGEQLIDSTCDAQYATAAHLLGYSVKWKAK